MPEQPHRLHLYPLDLNDVYAATTGRFYMFDELVLVYPLEESSFVLEAGCGSGKFGIYMSVATRANVTLIDNDAAILDNTRRLHQVVEILRGNRLPVNIRQADIRNIPYDDNSFHLVFNEGVLEHFKDPLPIVKEMVRVSRDCVIAIVPNALNKLQMKLAEQQMKQYEGKKHWAAYEKPFEAGPLATLFHLAGLEDVQTKFIWGPQSGQVNPLDALDTPENRLPQGVVTPEMPEDYRMILVEGWKK